MFSEKKPFPFWHNILYLEQFGKGKFDQTFYENPFIILKGKSHIPLCAPIGCPHFAKS